MSGFFSEERAIKDCDCCFDPEDDKNHGVILPSDFPYPLPYYTRVDSVDETLTAMLTTAAMSGDFPRHATQRFKGVIRKESDFCPDDGSVLRLSDYPDNTSITLSGGEGWYCLAKYYYRDHSVYVDVVARDDEILQTVQESVRGKITIQKITEDPRVTPMNFWYRSAHGYAKNTRDIEVFTWPEIRANYTPPTAGILDQLVKITPESIMGRLVLLHGSPGTGKTTFLRALSSEWRAWCRTEIIMDPEVLFGDSGYIMETMLGSQNGVTGYYGDDDDESAKKKKWRLVILEDTGELIAKDAKHQTGQALSRLLNIADGILGQGTKVIIAITTNENVKELHEAIVRPGRCLAQVEFASLSCIEARQWLAGNDVSCALENREYTLAELITIRNGGDLGKTAEGQIGQYL